MLAALHSPADTGTVGSGRTTHRSAHVAEKLGIGAAFPKLTLKLVGGGTLDLPEGLDAKYRVILFYRGHW